jgi:hypothetical protein
MQRLLQGSTLSWSFRHISGHQHKVKDTLKLDLWEKLNVEMDSLARGHLQVTVTLPRHQVLKREPWSVWIQDIKLVNNVSTTLYDFVQSEAVQTYWAKTCVAM